MKILTVKKVEKINKSYDLYDIETKNHNFYANGILVHNSNAGVCFNEIDGFWAQSRKNIITIEKDNQGCAFQVYQNKDIWISIIKNLASEYNIDLSTQTISLYFEWCGGSIFSGKSACSNLDKRSVIFQHFKVSPIEPNRDIPAKWLETKIDIDWVSFPDKDIYNIMNYKVWEFEIDFSEPLLSQNKMIDIVEKEIEPNSPVGQSMGVDGNVGEGMVCTVMFKDNLYKWKVKGDKHTKSKVTKLKVVDEELEKNKIEFANYACSSSRLEQAWCEIFGINNEICEPDVKKTGDFLRAVIKDVLKEEMDILIERKLEPKMVNSKISDIARMWFMDQLNKEVFGK